MPANSAAWLGGVAMVALVLFSAGVLGDGDTFSHIAAGGWMIDHRAVLGSDPFSFSRQGAPWVAHEWLAEVVMAAAFRAAGWSGVVVLTALAAGAAFFQLGRHLSRWLPAGAALLLMVLGGGVCDAGHAGAAAHPGVAGFRGVGWRGCSWRAAGGGRRRGGWCR